MKALTLWQPYASLIAIGAKPFETRSYPPPAKLIGQRIAIHAAVKPIQAVWRMLPRAVREAIALAFARAGITDPLEFLPHGAVVCTAVLAGAYECDGPLPDRASVAVRRWTSGSEPRRSIAIDPFGGDYSPGRWAWLLTDVEPLPQPLPAKGKQGWWEWDHFAGVGKMVGSAA